MGIEEYFSTIPASHRAVILVGGLVFFWMLESFGPLMQKKYRYGMHAGTNLFFTLSTIIVNFGFAFLIVISSHWESSNKYGLLYIVSMPLWLQTILAMLLLDLISAYLVHIIQHKVKWMWRFHLVHHSDMHVDATTANRHHPVESILRAIFTLMAVIISGAPMWMIMFYQSVSVVMSQFNHANIKLPGKFDRLLSAIIVSPDMHKVHHHYVQPFTDKNYGNIFSFWDRLLAHLQQ